MDSSAKVEFVVTSQFKVLQQAGSGLFFNTFEGEEHIFTAVILAE